MCSHVSPFANTTGIFEIGLLDFEKTELWQGDPSYVGKNQPINFQHPLIMVEKYQLTNRSGHRRYRSAQRVNTSTLLNVFDDNCEILAKQRELNALAREGSPPTWSPRNGTPPRK